MGDDHLRRIIDEAGAIVLAALGPA
jgi:hypothetical protein